MTVPELMVLNMALDGKDIFGLPSFDSTGKSELLINSVKEVLIEKEILNTETAFTMKGVRYVKNMKDYKEAKKYVLLGPVLFGVIDAEKAIVLETGNYISGFEFHPVKTKDIFEQISGIYPFLKQGNKKKGELIEKKISYKELKEAYGLSDNKALHLSTYAPDGIKLADEIIFSAKGELCFYDCTTGSLTEHFGEAEMIINERMS
jgi:hypothetical protein